MFRIFVTAKPNAREDRVEKIDPSTDSGQVHFVVSTTEPPVKGQANRAIVKLLAEHFSVSPLNISIVSDYTSRQKIIEIK